MSITMFTAVFWGIPWIIIGLVLSFFEYRNKSTAPDGCFPVILGTFFVAIVGMLLMSGDLVEDVLVYDKNGVLIADIPAGKCTRVSSFPQGAYFEKKHSSDLR